MKIAIDNRQVQEEENKYHFIIELVVRLAQQYPQHQFICICEKTPDKKLTFSKNIDHILTKALPASPFLWRYVYNFKLPVILKKCQADVFISGNGIASMRTTIPQCLLLPDLTFLQHPKFITKKIASFYKKLFPGFASKVHSIIAASEYSRNILINTYPAIEKKIKVIHSASNRAFQPVNFTDKEYIKEKFTAGKEYFLYTGNFHPRQNLVHLLKAFSLFKKWQKSNMQLVIAGISGKNQQQFSDMLQTFKHRNDVKLLLDQPVTERAKILAAAYALVYPAWYEDFTTLPLEAMQSEVPLIVSNTGALPEICGDGALYINPGDFNDIADKMMQLFKDENKRNKLIEQGKIQVQQFHWDKVTDSLWQFLQEMYNQI